MMGEAIVAREDTTGMALDRGGFARLDVSDLMQYEEDVEEAERERIGRNSSYAPVTAKACDWCGADLKRGSSDYRVIADNRYYRVCPTCWGRSPAYVELRGQGMGHEMSLGKIVTPGV